jgi:hypothetical protein
LEAECLKPNPDPAEIKQLSDRLVAVQQFDPYYNSNYPHSARQPDSPEEYARLRVQRIQVRAELAKIEHEIEKAANTNPRLLELKTQRAELAEQQGRLEVRMGDPLISVQAPADCLAIVAILPDGSLKPLQYDTGEKRWSARYDVPAYTPEGHYTIAVILVAADGTRHQFSLTYDVNLTPPTGEGHAALLPASGNAAPALRLEVDGDPDTARVAALLPWGDKVELRPSAVTNNRFFAELPLPVSHIDGPLTVTYILTNKAHNRTTLQIDLQRGATR